MNKQEAVNKARAKFKPKYTKEQKEQNRLIEASEKKLREYMEQTMIPELFKQEIRSDVLEMYGSKIFEALVQIQKGKSKEWDKYVELKRKIDTDFYAKNVNELQYND